MAAARPAWVRHVPAVAALLTTALLAYAPTLDNGFVWDDGPIVVENPTTRDLASLPHVVLSPDESPPYYRPLTRASFLIDYQLFGMDPRGFHGVNLLVHLASILAMYALGLRLFASRAPAFVAALLLAVHPLNAEAVNFVTGRNNALTTLFAVLAVVLLIDAERRRSVGLSIASGAAFLLGLLAKEPAAMALPVMAAWLWFPRAFGRERRGPISLLLPHAVACVVYGVMRITALGGVTSSVPAAGAAGLGARLLVNAYAIPRELSLVLLPRDLAIFHPIPAAFPVAALVAAWVAIAAGALYLVLRPAPASTFGLLWFALHLVPIANIVGIPATSLIAERYLYAPAVGLWVIGAELAARVARRAGWRGVLAGVAAVSVALVVLARERTLEWRDDHALAASAVRAEPGSAEAHFNLGVILKDRGDIPAARGEWDTALRLDPTHARALVQRGTASAVTGDLRAAEEDLRRALSIQGDIPIGHFNLARVYELTNRRAEALRQYTAFLGTSRSPREAPLVARARERVAALGSWPP